MAKRLLARTCLGLTAIGGTFLFTAGQANAQAFSAASDQWAKTEAILGGAPSALQALLARQNGEHASQRMWIEPASFSRPKIVHSGLKAATNLAVLSGRPDVFGSVALRVGHTPLDNRWHRVMHAGLTGPAADFAKSLRSLDEIGRLEAVNRYVNRRVRYAEDERQYGRPDVWAAAGSTLRRGRGDCEDFAIVKFQMLRHANFSDRDLYLVIVKDLVRRADHAVVIVRSSGRMFMLDDGTDTVLDSDSVADYRPILTFAANGEWTHGYRTTSKPINVASAGVNNAPPLLAESDQRSWSASLLAFNTGFNK